MSPESRYNSKTINDGVLEHGTKREKTTREIEANADGNNNGISVKHKMKERGEN